VIKSLLGIISVSVLLLVPISLTPAFAQVTDFYWSEDTLTGDEVFTADAATQTVTQVTSGGFNRIDDVEIDPIANKLWWNNWNPPPGMTPQEGIYSSNLDGTGQVQVTSGAQSNTPTGFASGLHGLVLDPSNQVVFFTRGVSYANAPYGEVSRVNMDGTGYAQLNSPAGESWFPSGIERVGNTLYWGNPGVIVFGFADGAVNSMDTSGGNLQH